LELHAALKQAAADCNGNVPVVAYRRNRDQWYAVLPMDEFLKLQQGEPDATPIVE
jgi:hypothetical protein